jgi:hypothetical protein
MRNAESHHKVRVNECDQFRIQDELKRPLILNSQINCLGLTTWLIVQNVPHSVLSASSAKLYVIVISGDTSIGHSPASSFVKNRFSYAIFSRHHTQRERY